MLHSTGSFQIARDFLNYEMTTSAMKSTYSNTTNTDDLNPDPLDFITY